MDEQAAPVIFKGHVNKLLEELQPADVDLILSMMAFARWTKTTIKIVAAVIAFFLSILGAVVLIDKAGDTIGEWWLAWFT